MSDKVLLTKLEEMVFRRNGKALNEMLPVLENAAVSSPEMLNALTRGIERARAKFKQGVYTIPDFLLAIDAYREGLAFIRAGTDINSDRGAPQVVIGVVKGDVHDMGKNIVAAVLEASGYRVLDVGRNVGNAVFLDALKETNAPVLALSTMMSTTLANMRELIDAARRLHPEIAILVGGAPFDADLARQMGADGYAENAIAIPAEARRVLSRHTAPPSIGHSPGKA
jgi:methanogenic corrinoid protein MtbC1